MTDPVLALKPVSDSPDPSSPSKVLNVIGEAVNATSEGSKSMLKSNTPKDGLVKSPSPPITALSVTVSPTVADDELSWKESETALASEIPAPITNTTAANNRNVNLFICISCLIYGVT